MSSAASPTPCWRASIDLASFLVQRYEPAAVAFEPPRDVELEQYHAHDRRGACGQTNEIVDRDRRRSQQFDNAGTLVGGGFGVRRSWGAGLLRRDLHGCTQDRAHDGDHVGGLRHERCALLEQLVASLCARIERRAGHRKDLASLFEREPRRDQRA